MGKGPLMRILTLGADYLAPALRAAGNEVVRAGHGQESDICLNHPATAGRLWEAAGDFEPELFCYFDDGDLPLLIDPESVPVPAIFYSIDSYCNPWHVGYAHGFDLTLVAQKDFLPLFANENLRASWFPLFNFCDRTEPAEFDKRDIPVSFVGTLGHKNNPGRKPFLENFRKLRPIIIRQGDFRPIFGRSKIVLNQAAFGEINFRCFEAMACGCALLTEKCENGFDELFEPGVNILPPYPRNDARAAAEIAAEWLAKPQELAKIARAGAELAAEKHSGKARALELIRLASGLKGRRADLGREKPFVRSAFGMIAAELDNPELATQREFYFQLGKENDQ